MWIRGHMGGYAYLSGEGDHVVLAKRENIDILDDHQLIVIFVEDRTVHQVPHVLLVALGEVKHGLGISHGSFPETLTLRIFSDALEDCPDCSRKLVETFFGLLRGGLFPLSGSGA